MNFKSNISRYLGVFIVLVFVSCSIDSKTTPTTSTTTNSTGTAFTHTTIKPIFDSKCASCHASGKANQGDWLYNTANYETSIKGSISKVYSTTNSLTASMAVPKYGNLTQTEVDAIKTWHAAGYPASN